MNEENMKDLDAVEAHANAERASSNPDHVEAFWSDILESLNAEQSNLDQAAARVVAGVNEHVRDASPLDRVQTRTVFPGQRFGLIAAAATLCFVSGLTGFMLGERSADQPAMNTAHSSSHSPERLPVSPSSTSLATTIEDSEAGDHVVIKRGVIDAPMLITKPVRISAEHS